jgi:WD40 repeat protein
MARSFKIQPHYIPDVKLALKVSPHSTQRALAQHLGFALVTISRFLNGQGVDSATFKAICQELQLDWQKLADLSPAVGAASRDGNRVTIATPPAPPAIDWGGYCHEAPFFGRSPELAQLTQWIQDSSQVISLIASGGTGKTALAYQCIQTLQPNFEFCLWRSLIYAPSLTDLLTDILLIYNPQFSLESLDRPEKLLTIFLDFLVSHRCLIVLDNLESILQGGERLGHYRSGYEIYGQFLALIATANHQSCILITSREPVPELVLKDAVNPKVETLQLSGLARTESQKILETQGEFQGSAEDWQQLLQRYGGNPLALKILAVGIREIFNGDIHRFLVSLDRESWSFDAIEQLLDRQIDRLSGSEQEVLYWIAIKHEPILMDRLRDRILTPNTRNKLPEILRSLVGRGLTEKSGMKYALQPLVSEHVIQRLVNGLSQEFSDGRGQMLNNYVLLEAQAKDFIRDIQKRKLIAPLADKLSHDLGSLLRKQISALLQDFQHSAMTGYGPGNTINLLNYLGIAIGDYDFSGLPLWQADLRWSPTGLSPMGSKQRPSINLQGVNFAQCDLSQAVFHENFGVCTAVAFSPDRRLLATGDTNGEIHLWQLSNRQKLLTIAAHRTWIWSLAFSPDHETLASGGDDQVIKIWDRQTGHCRQTLQGHQGKIWALDYQSEGQYLMSASDRPQLKQWNLNTATCVNTWELPAGDASIRAIAVRGQLLAIGGENRVLSVWPVENAESPCLLVGHRDWIRSLAFDPTGEIIASGSEDGELRLWHWRDQTLLHRLSGHQKRIVCLRISPDGRLLASGSEDMTLKIWEIESGRCLQTIYGHQSFVWSVAFSADSKILASGSGDYSVRLWQVNTGKCYYKLQGYSSWSPAMAIDTQGRTLICGNDDGTIQRWQLSNPSQPQILGRHPQRVCAVAISPDDQLLATGGEEGGIQLWDLASDRCVGSWQAHHNSVWSLAFSPTDAHLASSGEDGCISVWEWEHHRCLYQLLGHDKWVATIAYTTDGQTLISGSHDRKIKVWDLTQQQCRLTFSGHQGWIWKLVLSPDDRFVASCSLDRTIKLWRLDNGECLQTFIGHSDIVWSVAFHPDGRQLASASSDLTVKIWDIATGECLQTFSGYSANLGTVLFSPNGDRLFCSNQDEIIKAWDLPSGKSLSPLKILKPYSGMSIQGVKGLTFQQQQTLYKLGAV